MKTLKKGENVKLRDYVDLDTDFYVVYTIAGATNSAYNCAFAGLDKNGTLCKQLNGQPFIVPPSSSSIVTAQCDKNTFRFLIKLTQISNTVEKIIAVVRKNDASSIRNAKVMICTISGQKLDAKLAADFTDTDTIFRNDRIVNVIEFYRYNNEWKIRAVVDRLVPELKDIVKKRLSELQPHSIAQAKITSPPILTRQTQSRTSVTSPIPSPQHPQINWYQSVVNGILSLHLFDTINIPRVAKRYFFRHCAWTLWFWFPFGAVFGWLHLALKTFRPQFFFFALFYGVFCVIPYLLSLSSLNFGLIIIAPWIIGLISCYASFNTTLLKTLDSMGRSGSKIKTRDNKYELNSITYEVYHLVGIKDYALPIFATRCERKFEHLEGFYKQLRDGGCQLKEDDLSMFDRTFYIEPITPIEISRNQRQRSLRRLLAVAGFFALLTGLCYGGYVFVEHLPPDVRQHTYIEIFNVLDWDYYKEAEGIGSGIKKEEALQNAKVNALANGLGEELFRKEVGSGGVKTISDDEGDKNSATQDSKEDYTKQVQGRVSDIEIVTETQSDGLWNITIKAKVLVNAERKNEK
jgi:hypothetical protein